MGKMKCVIRDNLNKMNLSVRGLAEKADNTPGSPAYSTIDNFIRKGTGNLDTAWSITNLMGLTLNDNFVDEDSCSSSAATEAALKAIITHICGIGKIEKPDHVAEILLSIGKTIMPLGYEEEAGCIIGMGADFIKMMNERGGNGDE